MGLKRPTGEALAQLLSDRIGHVFADLRLLETALTHSSAVKAKSNNERLEFLGDRVLGLVIADLLYRQYPDQPEGGLAPRFNALVDTRTCADVGTELELETLIRSDAALRANKPGAARNYLSDAVEALIAAIYLDGGMDAAQRFVLRYWEPRSRAVVAMPRNPKSELQEWAVQHDGARPDYVIDGRTGPDHQPVFTVSVHVPGFAAASATGPSRRAAEEAAAIALMKREGVWNREDVAS
jgi:ribonuclease-3